MNKSQSKGFIEFEYLKVLNSIFKGYAVDRVVESSFNGLKNFQDLNAVLKYANKNQQDYSIFNYYKELCGLIDCGAVEEFEKYNKNDLATNHSLYAIMNISEPNIDRNILTNVVEKFSAIVSCACCEFESRGQQMNHSNFGAFVRAERGFNTDIWINQDSSKVFQSFRKDDMNLPHFCLSSIEEGLYSMQIFVRNNAGNLFENSINAETTEQINEE